MKEYEPKDIEQKWQKLWAEQGIYEAKDSGNPKWYSLIEFPYPSGDGLHVGHPRPYIGMDVISRKRRMEGFDVLYPIGWDAFGLPTENYAIKTGRKPADITKENTDTFRRQIQNLGISFDWSREINTTDPKYYKWTQWLFLKFLEKGLAYKAKQEINWCPKDKIGLANEEVVNGACERCGTPVEKREKEQWMLAITKYADRLDRDLDEVDYPERVRLSQKNWIGKSEGAEIDFKAGDKTITVFTTRPDTIFGATFLAVSPKLARELAGNDFGIKTDTDRENKEKLGADTGLKAVNPANNEEIPVWVVNYVSSDYGTGAIMGVPAHDERDNEFAVKYGLPVRHVVIPSLTDHKNPPIAGRELVFREAIMGIVRDPKTDRYLVLKWKTQPWTTFVMGGVEKGEDPVLAARREIEEETGYKNLKLVRVLGGPTQAVFYAAHKSVNRIAQTWSILFELENDEKHEISEEESAIHEVIWMPVKDVRPEMMTHIETEIVLGRINSGKDIYTGEGVLINSDVYNGKATEESKRDIAEAVGGKWVTKFKLRDWVFSRQRYWGEPIPVVHCASCGIVPVPERDLPVLLPEVDNYQPTETGESPLANIKEWVNTKCPKCGGEARRETDVMPNWAGSSWYFLRYADPANDKEFASMDALKHWMPVDWYNGGMEHTTLHLLYSRFWNKFLFDLGLVPTSEPYKKRTSHGLILAEGGEKMSKSKGNVVNPDSIVERLGADTLRVYEMFMGPFEQAIAWSDDSLVGPRRFLERVWNYCKQWKSVYNPADEFFQMENTTPETDFALNTVVKRVTEDIEQMKFNTTISSMMVFLNYMQTESKLIDEMHGAKFYSSEGHTLTKPQLEKFLKVLAPFAPHITEELWHELGNDSSIHTAPWPKFDDSKLKRAESTIAVQVNGKVRASMSAASEASKDELEKMALEMPEIGKWIEGKAVEKVVVVPGKIVNIVVK